MEYDLTAFLTTIAASSSSIVAILGGFIASKLISINGEREATLDELKTTTEEIRFKNSEIEVMQEENDSNDALTFIHNHMEDVIESSSLDSIYDISASQPIAKDKLQVYWNKAIDLLREFEMSFENKPELNNDKLPKELAQRYLNDNFAYDVLSSLSSYFQKIAQEEKRKKSLVPVLFDDSVRDSLKNLKPVPFLLKYEQNKRNIDKLKSDILYLEFKKGQLEEQRKKLKKPKGVKAGLLIFALFTVACIITPLAMSPRYVDDLFTFWIMKSIILFLFVTGLTAVFSYLVYLLRWDESENDKKPTSEIVKDGKKSSIYKDGSN